MTPGLRKGMRRRSRLSMAWAFALTCSISAGSLAGPVTAVIPAGPSACSFDGWVSFAFDAQVPVHEGPSEETAILGYLPNRSNDPDEERYAVEFHVSEARPGWLRIQDAQDREGSDAGGRELPPRPVYQGEGWIRAHLAQVGVQSSHGYARPDARSERIVDLRGRWLTEVGWVNGIRACSGEWLLLDFVLEDRAGITQGEVAGRSTGTAWFRGICSIQETTCDRRSADELP